MGEIPRKDNVPAEIVNSIIHGTIFELALNAVKAAIVAQVPFLGWPIISSLFSMFLNYIGGYVYTYLSHVATFTIINLQTDAELKSYNESLIKLTQAAQKGEEDALNKAKEEFKKNLGSLIKWDGIVRS